MPHTTKHVRMGPPPSPEIYLPPPIQPPPSPPSPRRDSDDEKEEEESLSSTPSLSHLAMAMAMSSDDEDEGPGGTGGPKSPHDDEDGHSLSYDDDDDDDEDNDVSSLGSVVSVSTPTPTAGGAGQPDATHESQHAIRRIVQQALLEHGLGSGSSPSSVGTVPNPRARASGGSSPPPTPRGPTASASPSASASASSSSAAAAANDADTGHDDDDTDLDSDGFYWKCGVNVVPSEYSNVLDKALQRKSQRMYEMLSTMSIPDPSVQLAVKEVIATDEGLPCILKRMFRGIGVTSAGNGPGPGPGSTTRGVSASAKAFSATIATKTTTETAGARDSLPPTWEDGVKLAFYSKKPEELRRLVMEELGKGYVVKHGDLYQYDVPSFLCTDAERNKLKALRDAVRANVKAYDHQYKALRENFRDILLATSRKAPSSAARIADVDVDDVVVAVDVDADAGAASPTTPSKPKPSTCGEVVLPVTWLETLLTSPASRFNAYAFIRDCKIGRMEMEERCFDPQVEEVAMFTQALNDFVAARQKGITDIGRHCLFDLKRGDDVVSRFLRASGDGTTDVTLLFHKLSVLLAKECVLLRLHVNYAYPNVAMLLQLIEAFEHDEQRRLLAPFFPPLDLDHLQAQVTNMGIVEDDLLRLTTVYEDADAVALAAEDADADADADADDSLRPSSYEGEDDDEDDGSREPLRFTTMLRRFLG